MQEARRAVVELAADAGASRGQLGAIKLAASEALTNVALHAYRTVAGQMHLNAGVIGAELWVLIANDGYGLSARPLVPALN